MNGCRTNKPGHAFDPVSGWCAHECGHRDDGRLVIHGTEKRAADSTQSPAAVYTNRAEHDPGSPKDKRHDQAPENAAGPPSNPAPHRETDHR